jgi:glycosyltransferase involved in cell wall biosynthesis
VNDTSYDLVIPTIGRESLWTLLRALRWMPDPKPEQIVIVDDRASCDGPLWVYPDALGDLAGRTRVVRSGGRGPAAARNAGWRIARAPWVAFVDDDVVPTGMWTSALQRDLARLTPHVAASQGQITVPLPRDRRPTDRERTVARIAGAPWITADMAVRRSVLEHIGGFDERFPRAYREDSDLALRILDAGWELTYGTRAAVHLTSPASGWISIAQQAGNADDALMRRLHGPGWRDRIGAARGRLPHRRGGSRRCRRPCGGRVAARARGRRRLDRIHGRVLRSAELGRADRRSNARDDARDERCYPVRRRVVSTRGHVALA